MQEHGWGFIYLIKDNLPVVLPLRNIGPLFLPPTDCFSGRSGTSWAPSRCVIEYTDLGQVILILVTTMTILCLEDSVPQHFHPSSSSYIFIFTSSSTMALISRKVDKMYGFWLETHWTLILIPLHLYESLHSLMITSKQYEQGWACTNLWAQTNV